MKFYNREKELEVLSKAREISFNAHSQMTVLTGRRRVGKTSLILKSCENTPTIFLFVNRENEAALCKSFTEVISRTFNISVPKQNNFAHLFTFLMELGERVKYNLVIDEFQEFFHINPIIYKQIQEIWDKHRQKSNVNLIINGSVYTLMNGIFNDSKEPLYGCPDNTIELLPFSTDVIKKILRDHKANYTNNDLLALYTFTGGIPKYIELFMSNGATNMESMVDLMVRPESPFLKEGNILLIQDFGRRYGNYFSILSAIANGKNTVLELEEELIGTSAPGYLKRLEENYEVIKRERPIFAKECARTVQYEISDIFLRFWFRYFIKYNHLIESQNFSTLADIIKNDYNTYYSGITLEIYFFQKTMENPEFRKVGAWWEGKKNSCIHKIDVVGFYTDGQRAFVANVKRPLRNFRAKVFNRKVEVIRTKCLSGYGIEAKYFTLKDM